jgi:hypothetical protein
MKFLFRWLAVRFLRHRKVADALGNYESHMMKDESDNMKRNGESIGDFAGMHVLSCH